MISHVFVRDLWERAFNVGVLSELYRNHLGVWQTLKCVKLNRYDQYYTEPWVERLLRNAIAILKSLITQAESRIHAALLGRLTYGAQVKKNRFIPAYEDMERYVHGENVGFLSKKYLISAGLPRKAYTLYSLLKNGALPRSLVGQLNMHLYS